MRIEGITTAPAPYKYIELLKILKLLNNEERENIFISILYHRLFDNYINLRLKLS